MSRPLVCGFVKARNEVIRSGNIYRAIANAKQFCDTIVACDDASTDGTREYLRTQIPEDQLLLVPPGVQDFRKELYWKEELLKLVHRLQPEFIWWFDGDEILDRIGTATMRRWLQEVARHEDWPAASFHYTQMWRSSSWARTDDGFDDGWFIKLWRYSPDLTFEVKDGTHHYQFPRQIADQLDKVVRIAGREVLHYGNVGVNLRWKCIQYWGGLGGVDRHLLFDHAGYRPVEPHQYPEGSDTYYVDWGHKFPPPPFTPEQVARIRALKNLRQIPGLVTVCIPTFNRETKLPTAVKSVIAQTYENWVAVILDDGSTDGTRSMAAELQELDPRIFYCYYPENRGGVAVNEIGMALACEFGEYWTRLGNDDWYFPNKLAYDVAALQQAEAVYGAFGVVRERPDGGFYAGEVCNPPEPKEMLRDTLLLRGQFRVGWANCAVRTTVLRRIRERYGNFVDPRLRNMEDFLFNARVAREAGWVWRGAVDGQLVIDPHPNDAATWAKVTDLEHVEVDAVWRAATDGASGNTTQTHHDEVLTHQLIQEDRER